MDGKIVKDAATSNDSPRPIEPAEESPTEAPPPPPKSIFNIIYEANDENAPKEHITSEIQRLINDSGLESQYDIFFLYDEFFTISRFTSNRTNSLP